MTHQHQPTSDGYLTAIDLAACLRLRLAELGTDVDHLPEQHSAIGALLHQLNNHERDQLCELITVRLGHRNRDWPHWLDQLHDEALQGDAIDAARKSLAEHLTSVTRAICDVRRTRELLRGGHSSGIWDVEHAEGGTQFEHALNQLEFYAAAAQALNPTRDA